MSGTSSMTDKNSVYVGTYKGSGTSGKSVTEKYAETGKVTTTSGAGAVASTGALSSGYKNNDISSSAVSVETLTKTLNTYMRMGAYWTAIS